MTTLEVEAMTDLELLDAWRRWEDHIGATMRDAAPRWIRLVMWTIRALG